MRVQLLSSIVAVLTCALSVPQTAWSQGRTTVVVPSTTAPHVPPLDKGSVEGRTYKNATLGLELTVAPHLELGAPELKGTAGTVPLLVTVAAWGPKKWFSGREGTIFYADALAYYPEGLRSTDDYVRRITRANQQEGFEPDVAEGAKLSRFAGVSFARVDFRKGAVYEAVLVKACQAFALVFIFPGPDLEAVNKLTAATQLKLDSSAASCGK